MYYLNENLEKLNRIFDQNSREGYLRLDLNENPEGLPNNFIKETLNKVSSEFIAKYPETNKFTKKLCEFIGVEDNSEICLTNGSAEAIRYVIEAYTRTEGKVLSVTPSYAMYEVYCKMYGRKHISIGYNDDLTFDVEKLVESITPDIDLVIVSNPNNPVGNVYSYDDMDRIIEAAKKNSVTVLIDEAYHYFYSNSFIKYALNNENVFLTRTFSKLFSLAGCRLGYIVGKKNGISIIQKLCTPHNVNAFAMLFAQSIIEKEGMVDYLINIQLEGKKFLIRRLKEYNYNIINSEGNFIFIEPQNCSVDYIVKKMKNSKKILIKSYKGLGNKKDYLRVTTGSVEIMKIFLNALIDIDK